MTDLSAARLEDLRGPVAGEAPVLKSVPLPNGARVAITVQIVLEAWKGTGVSGNAPDYGAISARDYGGQTGIWRILDVLDELGIKASCSISTLVAEVWPDAVKAVVTSGHEVVGHCYSQDRAMSDMDEVEDFGVVSGAVKAFQEVAGRRPYGWSSGWSSQGSQRGRYTVLDLLKCGYIYTNDFCNADVPYVVAALAGQKLVSMPRTDEINDMFLIRRSGNPPGAYVEYFKRSFDRLYKEGGRAPKVLSCVAHATVTGRPWGASALTECIEYAQSHPGTWITTRQDVAENYLRALVS